VYSVTDSSAPAVAFIVIAARLGLALVFAVAGSAKLRDFAGTAAMLRSFGVPKPAVDSLARALPVAEIAVALALLPTALAHAGSIAACVLLLLFTAAIGINLARGRTPECRCFGQVAAAPIGATTLFRNIVLLGLAAFASVAVPEQSDAVVLAWVSRSTGWVALGIVVLGAFAVQSFLMLQILRQQGRMLVRLESLTGGDDFAIDALPADAALPGLPVGAPAPPFTAAALDGPASSLADVLAAGKRVALFFAHPSCGPCAALLPEIAAWQRDLAERLAIVVVSEGGPEENRRLFAQHGMHNVLLQANNDVSMAYQTAGTPAAVIVEADGTIGSGIAAGADAIRELIAAAAPVPRTLPPELLDAVAIGDAPETTLLFWSADCGYCRTMSDDLLAWERQHDAPLVLVAAREDAQLRANGLRARLVLDEAGRIAQAAGTGGTPMAVVIDASGTVVSGVAAGKDAVLRLLGERTANARMPLPA
jgi:methylamine dehydrogenase accessory protein MauD